MPLRGTPGVMLKIAQCEAAGRRGVEWATMLRDELSWQDDMEEAEEGDEDADEDVDEDDGYEGDEGGDSDGAEGRGGAGGAARRGAGADQAGGGGAEAADPSSQYPAKGEGLRERKATMDGTVHPSQAKTEVVLDPSKASAGEGGTPPPRESAEAGPDGVEEGVPDVASGGGDGGGADGGRSPQHGGDGKGKGKKGKKGKKAKGGRGRHKIGHTVKDDTPSISEKDAEMLRQVLQQLEEFDQVCSKVRAAKDKQSAMKHAAKRGQLCVELEPPVAEVLDVQEAQYAALHARLQRIASSLQKLEDKASELLDSAPMDDDDAVPRDAAGHELAVVDGKPVGDFGIKGAAQELEEAKAALAEARDMARQSEQRDASDTAGGLSAAASSISQQERRANEANLEECMQRVRDAERKVDQDAAQSNATHRQLDDAEAAMQAAVAHKDEAAIRAARAQLVRPPPTTPVPCKQTPS